MLPAVTGLIATLDVDVARMREACEGGFLTATDLAEELVQTGVPFRQAHGRAARIVTTLEASGRTLLDGASWLDPLP